MFFCRKRLTSDGESGRFYRMVTGKGKRPDEMDAMRWQLYKHFDMLSKLFNFYAFLCTSEKGRLTITANEWFLFLNVRLFVFPFFCSHDPFQCNRPSRIPADGSPRYHSEKGGGAEGIIARTDRTACKTNETIFFALGIPCYDSSAPRSSTLSRYTAPCGRMPSPARM